MTIELPAIVRLYTPDDLAFCRDSFYKAASLAHDYSSLDHNISKPGFRRRFERFSNVAEIWIIGHAEYNEPLFGWIAVTNLQSHSIVWWVYVKNGYRGLGFGQELLKKVKHRDAIVYPWRSRISNTLAVNYAAKYNPFVYEDLCFEN